MKMRLQKVECALPMQKHQRLNTDLYQIYMLKAEGKGKNFFLSILPFSFAFPLSFLPCQLSKIVIEKPSTQVHVKMPFQISKKSNPEESIIS
jgi:hypothetical protein